MVQDTDIESPEAAALAAQAADILSCAHAAAVEEANNQFCDDQDLGQHSLCNSNSHLRWFTLGQPLIALSTDKSFFVVLEGK